jgi:hypothetical protein
VLQISQGQYEAFEADTVRRWYGRLVAWLRQSIPQLRTMTDADLMALIKRQEVRTKALGLVSEREIGKWCFLAVVTRERLEEIVELSAILHDESQGSRERRLDILMDRYDEQGFEGVR